MASWRGLVLFLCLLLSACSRASSPLARLERDSPVQSQEVLVEHVDLNQRRNARSSEVHDVLRGGPINLAGILAPGTWNLSGTIATWQPRDGESASVTSPSKTVTDRTLLLMIFIHCDDVTKNWGVVHSEMVEARHSNDPKGNIEFRVRVPAPKRRGSYVLDIQLMDQSETRARGVALTKLMGFPIWRCQLNVK